jgi:Flp pilus assembly protein TadD
VSVGSSWSIARSVVAIIVLLGCRSGLPSSGAVDASPGRNVDGGFPVATVDTADVRIGLILKMVEQGQAHAALAHLDALPAEHAALPTARLARAEALRKLARASEAERLLRDLLDGPLNAEAYRGLGLLAAARGDLHEAVGLLSSARAARPTSPRIRNDVGYALLLAGRFAEAEIELRTAVELGDDARAVRNLVLVMFVRAEDGAALALAERSGLSSGDLDRIRKHAAALRGAETSERSPGGEAS